MQTLQIRPLADGFAICRGRHVVDSFDHEDEARRALRDLRSRNDRRSRAPRYAFALV